MDKHKDYDFYIMDEHKDYDFKKAYKLYSKGVFRKCYEAIFYDYKVNSPFIDFIADRAEKDFSYIDDIWDKVKLANPFRYSTPNYIKVWFQGPITDYKGFLLPECYYEDELPMRYYDEEEERLTNVPCDDYNKKNQECIKKNQECILDVLGKFEYNSFRIVIDPDKIDKCAKENGWDVETLTEVVLYHELGHWFITCFKVLSKSSLIDKMTYQEFYAQLIAYNCLDKKGRKVLDELSVSQPQPYRNYSLPQFEEYLSNPGKLAEIIIIGRDVIKGSGGFIDNLTKELPAPAYKEDDYLKEFEDEIKPNIAFKDLGLEDLF